MTGAVLDARAAGRATLARQHLLERRAGGAREEIAHLAGMQAQAPLAPYVGLWTRLRGFTHGELSALYQRRQVVRIALMRGTIHLVDAEDALAWRPLVDPVIARGTQAAFGRHYRGLDLEAVSEAARELTEAAPLTFARLGALLAERFPGRDGAALAQAARARLPLVQIPPRGVWGQGGSIAHTTARAWLGSDPPDGGDVRALVLRYLAAFGPASVMDAQSWSGLTRLREVFDQLRPQLRVWRGEGGGELFDLPEAPRPDPGAPAPARFLPEYDNLLFAHADRGRVNPEGRGVPLFPGNGAALGYFLLDGVYAGLWRTERAGGKRAGSAGGAQRVLLTLEHFGALSPAGRAQLTEEGLRLLEFLAPQAAPELRFTPAP